MSSVTYLTQEGYDNLKNEILQLTTIERPRISAQIAEARDKGDLSENAEYDAAKEAQGLLELRISKLQEILRNARVLDAEKIDLSQVYLLTYVKVRNLKNNAELKWQLVSEKEADLKRGRISADSPIGKALLGKSKGDKVEVQTPGGLQHYEVLDITRD
jgi:transcription elongation factor GreA